MIRRAHGTGLFHGSIAPGNILVQPDTGATYLLDFGLAPLVRARDDTPAPAADLAGFAAIARMLTETRSSAGH
jgi:serine/threonine protein kinase